jgi:8-oxo-dGTP diphosphatase
VSSFIHVAVGVLVNEVGAVLIARRDPDVHQGGLWEFPGGKLEPGELVFDALRRELAEELGIAIQSGRPLLATRHAYADREVLLDVWWIDAWQGIATGREGQPIAWVQPQRLDDYMFPAADRPIIHAIRLPAIYLITPEPEEDHAAFLDQLKRCLDGGVRLVQLRAKCLSAEQYKALTGQVLQLCDSYQAKLLVNTEPINALRWGAHGVHLASPRLLQLQARPLPSEFLVAASCHNAIELAHANAIGVDFAVLSPVYPTRSHPEARPLGWEKFHALTAQARQPVFALGGLRPFDLGDAWRHGAHGLALLSGLWNAEDPSRAARLGTRLRSRADDSADPFTLQ